MDEGVEDGVSSSDSSSSSLSQLGRLHCLRAITVDIGSALREPRKAEWTCSATLALSKMDCVSAAGMHGALSVERVGDIRRLALLLPRLLSLSFSLSGPSLLSVQIRGYPSFGRLEE